MGNPIFRQKSIDRVTSPDQMNDYIRVSNPQVWMILLAIIVLLVGICVWGIFGSMDTKTETGGVCKDGRLICYISENDYAKLTEDALISVNDEEYPVASVAGNPIRMSESEEGTDDYFLHLSGLEAKDWVYEIAADTGALPDGVYRASVVLERVKPMSFVLN